MPNIIPMPDGRAVSRSSDFILYSVEAEFLEKVVKQYGPCMYPISAGCTSLTEIKICSHKNECHRRRTNVCEGTGEGSVRGIST